MEKVIVKVGQEIAVRSGYTGKPSFGWIVERVTPTGRIVVTKGDRKLTFNAAGREIGDKHYLGRIDANVDQAKAIEATQVRRKAAAAALSAVKVNGDCYHWAKDTLLNEIASLEAKLAEARRLAEAI